MLCGGTKRAGATKWVVVAGEEGTMGGEQASAFILSELKGNRPSVCGARTQSSHLGQAGDPFL